MLSVFGDESSDETKQRVFAVAGQHRGPQQRPIRGSMQALASADGRFVFDFLCREYFADWKSKFTQLERKTRMNVDKCRAWLMERKLRTTGPTVLPT